MEYSHGCKTINVCMCATSSDVGTCEPSAYRALGMLCLNDLILVVHLERGASHQALAEVCL